MGVNLNMVNDTTSLVQLAEEFGLMNGSGLDCSTNGAIAKAKTPTVRGAPGEGGPWDFSKETHRTAARELVCIIFAKQPGEVKQGIGLSSNTTKLHQNCVPPGLSSTRTGPHRTELQQD